MASVDITKFFKWGVKGSGSTSTVAQALLDIQQATPASEGIGFLTDGNTAGTSKILGMTARGASIDFTTLGGGTLSSAADSAAITFTNAAGQSGGSVTFGVTSGTSNYLTVQGTGSTANNITYGLTEAVYDSAEHYFSTAGVLTSGVYYNAIYAEIGVTDTVTSNEAKVILNQGNQERGYAKFIGTTDEILIGVNTGTETISFGLAQAVKNSLALADTALQGFTIDGNTAVTNKVGDIETTGVAAGTGATAPYNATNNPVATQAYVDAVDTKYNHTLTVASNETTPTSFGTWTPTADGTITINQYAGSTAGLVPAKTNVTASTTHYLAENGTWQSLPSAPTITFGSAAASNDTASISVSVNGTPVSSAVVLTAAQNTTTITNETLGITITGDANTPTIGLTANTISELALAHTAVQPLNAAITEQPAFAVTNISESGHTGATITAQQFGQNTDKTLTNSASSTTFNIGNGALVHNSTVVFSANQETDVTLNQYDFTYSSSTLGINTQTPTSATNKIATMDDIASLTGAMHYKGAVSTISTTAPSTGAYYTATVGSDTYYLTLANPASGQSGAQTAAAGDVLVISGTSGITPFETGDMFVYSDTTNANVVQTNMTIGTGAGQVAANDGALTAGQIVGATTDGIATTGFTFDAESTDGTSTIGNTSTNAQVPTSKNVYDFVAGYVTDNAVNSVTDAISVAANTGNSGVTVTDTLTVDSGTPSTSTFDIVSASNSGITVGMASGPANTVEIGTTAATASYTAGTGTQPLATTNDNGVMMGSDITAIGNAINDKFAWEVITIS